MRKIRLTKGQFAMVDESDYDDLSRFSWTLFTDVRSGKFYAYRSVVNSAGKRRPQFMHRYLLKAEKGQLVDHKNLNGLDNRRQNIRLATRTQNQANRGAEKTNKLGIKGVSAKGNRFIAKITYQRKPYYLGSFPSIAEASAAYASAAIRFFGDFARAA